MGTFSLSEPHKLAYVAQEAFFARMAPDYITERRHTLATLKEDRNRAKQQGVVAFTPELIDNFTGVLHVTILRAAGMKRERRVDSDDTYAEAATAFGLGITKVISDTHDPVWNETFRLPVMFGSASADAAGWNDVRLKIVNNHLPPPAPEQTPTALAFMSFALQGMDDLLGEATVKLTADQRHMLEKDGGELALDVPLDDVPGIVKVRITYRTFDDEGGTNKDPARVAFLRRNIATRGILSEPTQDRDMGALWAAFIEECRPAGEKQVTFEKIAFIDHVWSDTQVWLSRNTATKQICVAFRATLQGQDWLTDLTANLKKDEKNSVPGRTPVLVHDGFWASWKCVERQVVSLLDFYTRNDKGWQVHVCGHSLGAAMAMVSSFYLAKHSGQKTYTVDCLSFAGPRVGNSGFATAWAETLSGLRINNDRDIVPHVPPRHVEGQTDATPAAVQAKLTQLNRERTAKLGFWYRMFSWFVARTGSMRWLLNTMGALDYHHVEGPVITFHADSDPKIFGTMDSFHMKVGAAQNGDCVETLDDLAGLVMFMSDPPPSYHSEIMYMELLKLGVANAAAAQSGRTAATQTAS